MPYIEEHFNTLTQTHGGHGSWMIWDRSDLRNTVVINHQIANTKIVGIGLNVSNAIIGTWSNFHAGTHDRKLAFALNDSDYRGGYLTIMGKLIK